MDKANAAEWLLRRVVDPARASELVGDQLEGHPAAGALKFWLSMTHLLLMFSWRTLLGVAASPVLGLLLAVAFFMFESSSVESTISFSPATIFHMQAYLLGISILLWAATAFSRMRLGGRSTLTRIGCIASLLGSASSYCFWQWSAATVLACLWVGFLVFCVISVKRGRALGTVLSAVAAAWLTAFALAALSHDPHSVFGGWQGTAALFLVPMVESATMLFLHRKLVAAQPATL